MEIDLSSKCRVCLSDDEAMHYLFNEFDQGITLQEILANTTTFEIGKDDGFSPYLCQNCTTVIVNFYNLKTVFRENEAQIKTLVASLQNNKDTVIKEDEDESVKTQEANAQDDDNDDDMAVRISSEEDYITIKVESGGESDEEDPLGDNFEPQNEDFGKKIVNQLGLSEDESDNLLEKTGESLQYEYQINTYTCPECGDCFLYKNDIQEHMSSKHEMTELNYEELSEVSLVKVKPVGSSAFCTNKCKLCHELFETIADYKEHIETHKKNVCDICGVGFTKKTYLKDHQEIHSAEKKHVCNYCNKAFKRRTVLVKHKRIHTHPRECVCEICGKAFNDKGTLKTHIMLLHVKERNYICLLCGVKFPLKATLEKHIRRHQNKDREFFCTQCPLGYRDKSSLDRHIYVKHSGHNVKSTCKDCGKQYTTASSLLKHQRVCHASSRETDPLAEKIG